MSLKFTGEIPFSEVYVTGLVRDNDGQKMSKSKGNIIDPIDIIDGIELDPLIIKRQQNITDDKVKDKIAKATQKAFPSGIAAYGTDALRFTFCSLASTGRDVNFDLGRIDGYHKFCNKLWNASRFVILTTDNHTPQAGELSDIDQWIVSELHHCIAKYTTALEGYRFDLAANTVYEFIWHQYCDWYIELAKSTLDDPDSSKKQKAATSYTLVYVLETTLRLLHPIMPFITEEIWQTIAPSINTNKTATIMLASFPVADSSQNHTPATDSINWLKAVVSAIRNMRSQNNISPKKQLAIIFSNGSETDKKLTTANYHRLSQLVSITSIEWQDLADTSSYMSQKIDDLMIHISADQVTINLETEKKRLTAAIKKTASKLDQLNHKVTNHQFMDNAPAEVVSKVKQQQQEFSAMLTQYQKQLENL